MKTKQLSAMLTLIKKNVSAGFIFSELTRQSKDFVSISTNQPIHADVSLVWNKDFYNFDSMEKFKEYVRKEIRLT